MQLWDIEEHSDFPVKGRFQRDENGNECWVISAKRQFRFDGQVWHEDNQALLLLDEPIYAGEPGFSAMLRDSDFVVAKQATDVYLVGKAKTPAGKPAKQQLCRLFIDGHIDKSIKVIGERSWVTQAGSVALSYPQEFIERKIDYSMAIGGEDPRNRLGCGVAHSLSDLLNQFVPSIFSPNEDWQPDCKKLKVIGFGPIPPFFEQRSTLAGTFDEAWHKERKPLFPKDFNHRFYQSAPCDQQCSGFLVGGERVVAAGFHPDHVFSFIVPRDTLTASVQFTNDALEQLSMNLYSIVVDADSMAIELTYSCAVQCQGREEQIVSSRVDFKVGS